jgi:GT2 family glycosyltransferase
MSSPLVTLAVPSYNQGRFLQEALNSIFAQDVPVEIFVADGGSSDRSVDVIRENESRLAGWRSHPDNGQAAAINECIAKGQGRYVGWLNSDDCLVGGGLRTLLDALEVTSTAPAAYGKVWNCNEDTAIDSAVWVEAFSEKRLALRCIISQPGTLIRRSAWDAVGGLDENLQMALDYDLWWRLCRAFQPLQFVEKFVALNRRHPETKTNKLRRLHYQECIRVVRKHSGRVPLKWWLAQPYAFWLRSHS